MNLGKNTKVTLVNNGETAGTGTITSDEIDMTGYEGCLFIVHMGTIVSGAATTCFVRQAIATGMSGGAELSGTIITILDSEDDTVFLMDVYRPAEQFLDVQVTRATQDATIQGITAIQYGPRKAPPTHDASTVSQTTTVAGPDEA